jgi:hypothetical protein
LWLYFLHVMLCKGGPENDIMMPKQVARP